MELLLSLLWKINILNILNIGIPEKWSPENWSPEKWSPENWSPGNSETKNRGVGVEHRGVCVECWDVINLWKPKTRQQTQNSETNPKDGNKKSGDHFSGDHFSGDHFSRGPFFSGTIFPRTEYSWYFLNFIVKHFKFSTNLTYGCECTCSFVREYVLNCLKQMEFCHFIANVKNNYFDIYL